MKSVDFSRFEIARPTLPINVIEHSTDDDDDYTLVPFYSSINNESRRVIDLILYKDIYIYTYVTNSIRKSLYIQ